MTMNLYELATQARSNSERWFPAMHDESRKVVPIGVQYALGLAGEAGEVSNVVKKGIREGKGPGPELAAELADVLTYLLLLAYEVGVDLEEEFQKKQAVCEQRWGRRE
jgi:NTP pyrophosphatase (non-canonical NTP hydrolase)